MSKIIMVDLSINVFKVVPNVRAIHSVYSLFFHKTNRNQSPRNFRPAVKNLESKVTRAFVVPTNRSDADDRCAVTRGNYPSVIASQSTLIR